MRILGELRLGFFNKVHKLITCNKCVTVVDSRSFSLPQKLKSDDLFNYVNTSHKLQKAKNILFEQF